MCVSSMVGDHYSRQWQQTYPSTIRVPPSVERYEFDALKREVEEMKEAMRAAKLIDRVTGQPGCEQDGKVALLRKIAEMVGVDLEDVLAQKETH